MTTTPRAPAREIFGWAMYDFANSSYTTVIVTVVFSVIFPRLIVGDGPGYRQGNLLWSVALSVSYGLVVLTAPVLGAIIDFRAAKKRFLFGSCLLTVAATALLYVVSPGQVLLGVVLVVVSNYGFSVGESFTSSFLPDLGPPEELGGRPEWKLGPPPPRGPGDDRIPVEWLPGAAPRDQGEGSGGWPEETMIVETRAVVQSWRLLALTLGAAALGALPARAVDTATWEMTGPLDLIQTETERVSITSRGVAKLAPRLELALEPGESYIWSLAAAKDGTVYAGTGDGGLIAQEPRSGRGSTLHDSIELEILSVAAGPDGAVYAGGSPDGVILRIAGGKADKA